MMQKELGHKRIDLFKADIEGYEFGMFENWPKLSADGADQILLPMQVLVEVHFRTHFQDLLPPHLRNQKKRSQEFRSPVHMVELQQHLLEMGYVVVYRDDNRMCKHCTELTLVRVQCPQTGVYQIM